ESTWELVQGEMIGRELDRIAVKGKAKPVRVYELVGRRSDALPPRTEALLRDFPPALEAYQAGRFAEARAAFEDLARRHPEDGPTALYLERCRRYLADPPPPGWDGVHRLEAK